MSVSVVSEASIWEDWSGRGSHVDFGTNEKLPLNEGRLLGHGIQGSGESKSRSPGLTETI